jgi:putative membrane protein insertion efficiency factor
MIAALLLYFIRIYQRLLSPLLGPVCRFTPSCSQYMAICIEHHGAGRGVWLGVRRLSRCHPFHPGGVDLPPEPSEPRP